VQPEAKIRERAKKKIICGDKTQSARIGDPSLQPPKKALTTLRGCLPKDPATGGVCKVGFITPSVLECGPPSKRKNARSCFGLVIISRGC